MKKIILIINVLIVLMCTNYTSYSQLTRTQLAKEQFNHSLFDDRGYSKNYSNYQRLNIGNSNGNLIYTYPISSENIHDGKLNLTMTFNANVNYVSLSEFNGSWEGEGNYWHSINANKSAWILGVNEFAVQTLTAQTMIYPDPNIKQVFRSDSSVTSDTIEMTKLINNWGIEGYHFCNEMKVLEPSENAWFNYLSVDQIKLLKSDGNVLLLRNGDRDSANLDIGQYYPVGTNEKGYGIVEYLDPVNFTEFSKYIEIIKQGLNNGNLNIAKYDGQFTFHDGLSFDKYDQLGFAKPRKLRYFPGDGYEYEFIEYYAPYGFGAICKMSAELKHYGGYKITPSAHPTIFYLHKVYYNDDLITKIDYGNGESKGHLLPFPEFDNNNQMLYYAEYDNIPGRANCTDIGGIQINYNSPKELEIKNNRLKITTKFDLVRAVFTDSSKTSNKSSNVLVKLNNAITSDLANNSYELDKINTIIDNAPRYYANSNITKIKVNEKVVTEFDYNSRKIEYKRRFFPILHSRTDIDQSIKNPRKYSYRVSKLSGITEYDNQVKYSFRYLLEPTANVGSNDNICIDLCNGDGNEFPINGLQSYPNNIDNLQSYEWADACTRTKVGTVMETQMDSSKLMKKIRYEYDIVDTSKKDSKTIKWTNFFSSADPAQAILSHKDTFDFNMKVIMPNDSLGGSELYTIFSTNMVKYVHRVLSLITDGQNTPVLESTVKTSTYKDESNDTLYSESNIILPIKEETTTMHGDTVSHVEVNYDYKLTADPIRNFKRVGITRFYGRNLETITTITKQSMPNQNPITTVQISNFKSYPLILNKEFYKYFTKTNSSNYFTSASSQYLHKCDCDNKSEQLQESIYQPTCSKGRPIIPLYNELQTQSFTYRYCSPDESPYLLEGKNINYYYDSIPITDISSDESAKNNYDMRHKNAKPEQITVYKPGFLSEYDDEDKILSINRYTSKPINKLTDNQYDYTSNIDERVNGQCGTTYSRECLLGQVKKQINTISNDTINYIYALSFDKIPTNVRDSLKYAYNDFSISKFKEVSEDFFTSKYYMIKYQGKDDIDEHTPFELSVVNSAGQIEISNNYSDYLTTYQYEGLGRIASITAPLDYSQSLSNKKYGAS